MSLGKPNCYDCAHHFHCSFRRSIDNAVKEHIGWVNVDKALPDWLNLFVSLAEACTEYSDVKE